MTLLYRFSRESRLSSTWSQTQKSRGCPVVNTCSQVLASQALLAWPRLIYLFIFFTSVPQSCTLFGRTRSGLPSPRGRWTRSGTADTTSGCWRESWCILDSGCPGDEPPDVFIFLSEGRRSLGVISQQAGLCKFCWNGCSESRSVHVVLFVTLICF